MRVIGISGVARSGKDTVADYINDKYGYEKFVLSDILRDKLASMGRDVTKKNMVELGNELRKEKGNDIVARLLYERCKDREKICVVGFRSPGEVDFFESVSESFFLIEVRASRSLRVERAKAHGMDDVSCRDYDDIIRKGLDMVLSMATIRIENESGLDELYGKVDDVIVQIG